MHIAGAALDEDKKVIARFQEESAAMRAEIAELRTKARAQQLLPGVVTMSPSSLLSLSPQAGHASHAPGPLLHRVCVQVAGALCMIALACAGAALCVWSMSGH